VIRIRETAQYPEQIVSALLKPIRTVSYSLRWVFSVSAIELFRFRYYAQPVAGADSVSNIYYINIIFVRYDHTSSTCNLYRYIQCE